MSTLIDRMISTLMASLVVASGVGAVIGWSIYSVLSLSGVQPSDVMLLSISTLFIPVLFAMSYIVFTRGETLRTAKRFKVLAGFLLPPVTIIIGLAIAWLIVMF
jgi:hypothetical protein